jgi:subtilisin family serine protease
MSVWNQLRTLLRGPAQSLRRARVQLGIHPLEERLVPAASSDFRGIIGLPAVQANYPYRGDGYSVAIIDTGVNYNDPNLGGGWGKRVIAGWNFVANTGDPMDDNGHGTFVAGEIASSSTTYPGVAPNVNLIALKALDANNYGSWSNIDAALKWVIAHQAQYHIVAVNMSLGSGNYTTDQFSTVETELATLKQAGVFTSAASGNQFATFNSAPGLAYPAVDPDVVSVGATWAGSYGSVTFFGVTDSKTAPNTIANFTQRDSALGLLAPGAWITGESRTGGYTQYGGTSMAAAIVSGSAVLLHQELDAEGLSADTNQAFILKLMQSTGLAIVDNSTATSVVPTGLTFKQLNLKAAMDAAAALAGPPTLAPIAAQTIAPTGTVTVPLSASDASGAPVTLTAQLVNLPALAYQIKQQLGLSTTGSYYLNKNGYNEKWLVDRNRNWYFILPNGQFYRFVSTMANSLLASNLVAIFDPSYYADPRQLWYTPYVAYQPVSLTITGNTLTVHSTSATWTGQVPIMLMASNGDSFTTQTFTLTVAAPAPAVKTIAAPPQLAAIANQSMSAGQLSLNIPLSATDPNGDTVTLTAAVLAPSALAYQLNQQYGFFVYNNSYYTNTWGANEKWLGGNGGSWFALLPNGKLYRWTGDFVTTVTAANLVATLDPMFYTNPQLLWSAQPPVVPAITAVVQGNTLTLSRPSGLKGIYQISVTASDGTSTSVRTFWITLN